MECVTVTSEQDYKLALKRIEALFDAEPGTPEGDELEMLVCLVEAYEDLHYPI
ncbi:transcriptional regulator [Enterovibrio norvegicus]|uniref:HTH-type transcriptional regulator / antitoxin HigA n=1 Tax=Enterovibrio norvegicus DSM 15893 TaxID=1121869 RepID=A0A1I5XSY8_9GAMM|nr:transcriptional regulator [Enterovibrio norvegicus]SFQ35058.1 HTH-type transcriptional regulator / antitoxin HigA [Enterovibrio norvegicus DSM 15893]